MTKTVVAVYDHFRKAYEVVEALQQSGFDRMDINVIANDASGAYADYLRRGEAVTATEKDVEAGEGAGFGAMVGALTGILIGLGALVIPGVGPVVAAGPIISALAAGTVGAAAGALTGGIVAALVDLGVDEADAGLYAEGIRRGGTMVAVRVRDEVAPTAARVMESGQPIDIEASRAQWRAQGWERYIEGDEPYPAHQIDRQRDLVNSTTQDAHLIKVYGYDLE